MLASSSRCKKKRTHSTLHFISNYQYSVSYCCKYYLWLWFKIIFI